MLTNDKKRRRWLAWLVAVPFVAACCYFSQFVAHSPEGAKRLFTETYELIPGLYVLGKMMPAAAYVVETSDGLVLIDSGMEERASGVVEQLAHLKLDIGRIRAILLTHVHGDHSLGAEYLRGRTGAKIYAGRGDSEILRAGGPREAFFSTYDLPELATHRTTLDVALSGGETLEFGNARIRVIAAPGHTPGSICYLLELQGRHILFTGDVIQHLDPDTEGDLGTYTAYLPPLYRGNVRDYLATLKLLSALPLPDLVLPGHPAMDPNPQDPHLSRERWQALIVRATADMSRLLGRYETDGANFLDGIAKELLPGLNYLGNFGQAAVYCLRSNNGTFLVDAPGGDNFAEFLAAKFQALGLEQSNLTAVMLTSAGDQATAGLPAIVKRHRCQVVAPKVALDTVRRSCPVGTKILTEEEFEQAGWLNVKVLPLDGRGLAPLAYLVRWSNKSVLLSGRIPVKLTRNTLQQLLRERARSDDSHAYMLSLQRLEQIKPELWLPALPVHGQNANLYDDDWQKVLAQNRRLAQ